MLHFRSNVLAKRKHQCFKCPVVTIHCTQQLMQSFPMKKQHFRKVKKHLHCLVTCCSQISALVIVRDLWCGQWYLQRGGERLSRRNFFSYGENFLAFLHDVVCHRNVTFVRHGDFLQHSVCPLILASCKKNLMAIFQNHPSAYLEVSFFLNNCCPEKRSNLFVWWVRKMIYWQPSRFYA